MLSAPAELSGGVLPGGTFDLALVGWFAGIDPDVRATTLRDHRAKRFTTTRDTALRRWMRRSASLSKRIAPTGARAHTTRSRHCFDGTFR